MKKLGAGSFQLEPDGFSIHTLEIVKKLSNKEYKRIRDSIYQKCPKGEMYSDRGWQGEGERYRCKWFWREGLRINLEKNVHKQVSTCYLRIAVNPRKLIDPSSSYLGILPPDEESIRTMNEKFTMLLKDSGLPCALNAYQLSRVDLCVNIRCDTSKLFKELLRVMRKLPTPPKYERCYYKGSDRKAANRYNKHHITFKHESRELVVYDKTYQIVENGLQLDVEKLPKGILRFEIHELRERVSKIEKKLGTTDIESLLMYYIKESEKYITRCFRRAFPDDRFMQPDALNELICREADTGLLEGMMRLAMLMTRIKSLEKGEEKLRKEGYDAEAVLAQFRKLGVSPIPLRKKFCAKTMPGPSTLLQKIAHRNVVVW